GEINSYSNNGWLTIFSNALFLGSNSTANPITIQGATTFNGNVRFNYGVSGLTLGINDIAGLQSELNSLRSAINNHTHTVTLPTHNHGNPQNQNWGGTFTTSTP